MIKADLTKLVVFQLGVDLFAAEVQSVERVLRYVPAASVPDVPPWIEGVLEYRGTVLPVVDMRRRIELAEVSVTSETRVLVLATPDGPVGAIVDAVHEVAAIPPSALAPPPALFRGLRAEFIRGVARVRDQLVVVLDVARVLSSADRIVFERAVAGRAAAEPSGVAGGA